MRIERGEGDETAGSLVRDRRTCAGRQHGTAMAQTRSASLEMAASSNRAALGEPVTFTITKTNPLLSDHPQAGRDWIVRDFLPAGVEFVSAIPSQGFCAVYHRAELGVPYNPTNG
jgi:uncharacterized repeat protein (TIGR01451 family)